MPRRSDSGKTLKPSLLEGYDALAELDDTDRTLLRLIQEEGRISIARLAEAVSLSETPCARRVKRLESEGYILGYQARLHRQRLGFGVLAFVQLSVSIHTEEATRAFEEAMLACPEVLACHNVTGRSDYLLQVVAPDLDQYGSFIERVLRKMPEIRSIESSLCLKEPKYTQLLPL